MVGRCGDHACSRLARCRASLLAAQQAITHLLVGFLG